MQRGKSIGGALFFFIFVFVMSIPILDILAGFAIIIYMPMLIFARSAQRPSHFSRRLARHNGENTGRAHSSIDGRARHMAIEKTRLGVVCLDGFSLSARGGGRSPAAKYTAPRPCSRGTDRRKRAACATRFVQHRLFLVQSFVESIVASGRASARRTRQARRDCWLLHRMTRAPVPRCFFGARARWFFTCQRCVRCIRKKNINSDQESSRRPPRPSCQLGAGMQKSSQPCPSFRPTTQSPGRPRCTRGYQTIKKTCDMPLSRNGPKVRLKAIHRR